MLDNANMSEAGASAMYEALMAVKPEGMSLSEWAKRAGVNRSIFNGIRAHGNPTMATLDRLLMAIDVDPSKFQAGITPVRSEVRGAGIPPREINAAWAIPKAKAVPVLGTAFGSDLEDIDGIETTELMLSEVLDYVPRPPSLANDETAYAVTTIGESMAPRFEPGELAFVSPKSPVNVGDDVLVQLKDPGENGDHNQAAERVTLVLLKRLVRRSSKEIELRQFNPEKTFRVPLARVQSMHRVRGRL